MLASSAGKRLVLLAAPFVALAGSLLWRPPAAVEEAAGAVRVAAAFVLVVALAGAAFGAFLWARGGDQVI